MESWIERNLLDLIAAVAGVIAAGAAILGVYLALRQTKRPKPNVWCALVAVKGQPGWYLARLNAENLASTGLRAETLKVRSPPGAKVLDETSGYTRDGAGGWDLRNPIPGDQASRSIRLKMVLLRWGEEEPNTPYRRRTYGTSDGHFEPFLLYVPTSSRRRTVSMRVIFRWRDSAAKTIRIPIKVTAPTQETAETS